MASKTVVVEIGPNCAGDHSNAAQNFRILLLDYPFAVGLPVNCGRRGFGITAGNHSSSDEEFERAIAIQVGESERTVAGYLSNERVFEGVGWKVVLACPSSECEPVLVIGKRREKMVLTACVSPRRESRLVAG